MVKICQKCGFENIDQTFYCSRCGDQIAKLPEKPVENISQESLKKSERARARSDALSGMVDWQLGGRVLGHIDRESISTRAKVMAIIAYIMIIIGIIGVLWGIQPTSDTVTGTISSGPGYYMYVPISNWLNGHLSGDFMVTSGDAVEFFVLNQEQYDEYSLTGLPSGNLYHASGTSGSFSVNLPTTATYYLAFDHGSGYDYYDQSLRLTYTVTGLDLTFLIGGIVVLIIGVVIAVVSRKFKSRSQIFDPEPTKPQAIDVMTFDNKPKMP